VCSVFVKNFASAFADMVVPHSHAFVLLFALHSVKASYSFHNIQKLFALC
jgi:hypothetical protein